MSNTNSLYTKKGRYVHGGLTETTKSRIEWWERKTWSTDVTDNTYVLEKIYEGRPEKLAGVLYGDTRLWWVILQYNNIINIDEEFVEGLELLVPTKERVESEFLNGKPGGTDSTRVLSPTIKPIVS